MNIILFCLKSEAKCGKAKNFGFMDLESYQYFNQKFS